MTELSLNDRMEFDHVVRVHSDETVTDEPGEFAPEFYPEGEYTDEAYVSQGWELMRGYTGQYGYNGPCMHPSEFIGGGLARDILETPGVYVAVAWLDDEGGDCWAVARKLES